MGKIDSIIEQIAKANGMTAEDTRREMEEAIRIAQQSPDPAVQARWASIPKKGKKSLWKNLSHLLPG